MGNNTAAKNTDRELWREREGDYYAASLFVTEGGGIGMDVGGHCIVKPIRDWFKLADSTALSADLDGALRAFAGICATYEMPQQTFQAMKAFADTLGEIAAKAGKP